MGTKLNPGKFDCYANAEEDEPMFVLLARDKHAPTLVWLWAVMRELDGEDAAKIQEARDCVLSMLDWQTKHDRMSCGVAQAALGAVLELIRCANAGVRGATNPKTDTELVRLFLGHSAFEKAETSTQG